MSIFSKYIDDVYNMKKRIRELQNTLNKIKQFSNPTKNVQKDLQQLQLDVYDLHTQSQRCLKLLDYLVYYDEQQEEN